MSKNLGRRHLLQMLGAGAFAAGCGSNASPTSQQPPEETPPQGMPGPQPTAGPIPAPTTPPDPEREATPAEMLAEIETIVVVMMENRSFDHYLGSLKRDAAYASASKVDGLTGNESNLAPNGAPVQVFNLTDFTVADPPHGWDASHAQYNGGKNDGFVKAHAGADQNDVMGYHDRAQLPFYYWLADNFTVCDRWFSSVMGPTWPNRFYLHAGTSKGKKDNTPFLVGAPDTLWDKLKAAGKSFKNYYAGAVAFYTGGFVGKLGSLNPTVPMSQFFADAKDGRLPNFSIIDPDFQANDDHPAHDIRLGQVFLHSIYQAMAESPQWQKSLLVITYDEHGGFFDHVPPPGATDDQAEFSTYGFRVPTIVVGPSVRKGYVCNTVFDHTSVGATLVKRFGIAPTSARMGAANDLSSVLDPKLYKKPRSAPPGAPTPQAMSMQEILAKVGTNSQEELSRMIADGRIPARYVDPRPHAERMLSWLSHAERLGALEIVR
jgi:phospholipase C